MKINFTNIINCIKYLNKEIVFLHQLELPEDWERKAFIFLGVYVFLALKYSQFFLIQGFKRFEGVLFLDKLGNRLMGSGSPTLTATPSPLCVNVFHLLTLHNECLHKRSDSFEPRNNDS